MNQISRLLVILGAGASYDSWLDAEPDSSTIPPLTANLFAFDEVLRQFLGADVLKSTIERRVREGQGLETVLAELAAQTDPDVRRRVRQVPPYLRALIGQAHSPLPAPWPGSETCRPDRLAIVC